MSRVQEVVQADLQMLDLVINPLQQPHRCRTRTIDVGALKFISRRPSNTWGFVGFLSEQTRSFASFVVSVHIYAVRHLMLAYASSTDGSSNLCEIREHFKDQLNQFSLARRLWHYFLALMGCVIRQMKTLPDDAVKQLICTLNREFEQFFESSLQLDPETIRLEHDPAPLT